MTPLLALFGAKARALAHAIAAVRRESALKVTFVSASVIVLWAALFVATRSGLRWLDAAGAGLLGTRDVSIAELLLPRLLPVFALVLFAMLIVSNALLSFANLYRSREVGFLLTTPLGTRSLFFARFAEIVFFSSWSFAYVASPILLSYGVVRHAPAAFYAAALAFYLPFVLIPAALGALITLVLVRLVPRLPRLALAVFVGAALIAALLAARGKLADPEFREMGDLGAFLQISNQAHNPHLPSFWASAGLLSATQGTFHDAAFYLLVLSANAFFLSWLAGELAARSLSKGWSALAAGAARGGRRQAARRDVIEFALRPFRGPGRWLAFKDVKVFARDPAQWSQVLVFFGVLALYIANMRPAQRGFGLEFWQSWITMLNTVACLLVLATLTTRFVFPLVSIEGRRFWLVGLAPLPMRTLVYQKFTLSVTFAAVITVALVAASSWRLHLATGPFALSVFTVCAASVALSGLAVGLGSIFANFAEDDPARIVSGMGGTLAFILSLAYVVAVAGAQTVVLQWRHLGAAHGGPASYPLVVTGVVSFITLVTAIATYVPLRLGVLSLERTEF